MLRKIVYQSLLLAELYIHLLKGKVFGISCIVRYLKNPNPLITVRLLQAFGAKIGEKTTIKRSISLDNVYEDKDSTNDFSHLKIGSNCYIGDCTYFDLANEIVIGNNTVISGGVSFVTHADCNRSKCLGKVFPRICERIIVEEGAWIAFKVTILNGVTVGENSVVAAHSLVKEDIEKHCVYAGIPAQKMRNINGQ
jgi:acetyltransferase-like isoleucine patch superfamily enzyme